MLKVKLAWLNSQMAWEINPNKSWLSFFLELYTQPNATVLDVGCGSGEVTYHINCASMLGVDIWPKAKELYRSDFCLGDITKLLTAVPNGRKYNMVYCLDVIEHLTKEQGWQLLEDMSKLATDYIVIFTPSHFVTNRDHVDDPKCWAYGNQWDIHKSVWSPSDLEKRHYDCIETAKYILAVKNIRLMEAKHGSGA